jgi:hypothetical protein
MTNGRSPHPPPDVWRVPFDRLVAEAHAERPILEDGCWIVRFDWVGISSEHILSLLPGHFERAAEHWEDMVDHTGESVDYESESGVWAREEYLAIFEFTDHWQAGLGGSLTVYPDVVSYREALSAAIASHNDREDGEPEESEPAPPRPMSTQERVFIGDYLRIFLADLADSSLSDELRARVVELACGVLQDAPLDERTLTDVLSTLRDAIDRGEERTLSILRCLPLRLDDGRRTDSAFVRLGEHARSRGNRIALAYVAGAAWCHGIEVPAAWKQDLRCLLSAESGWGRGVTPALLLCGLDLSDAEQDA